MFHRIKKMFKVTFLRYLERFFLFVANNLLLLTNLQVANGDVTTIVVDAPAVLLDAIDAVGAADDVVDVHDEDTIVGIDVDVVLVVLGTIESIAVGTFDEALAIDLLLFALVVGLDAIAFLFEVHLTGILLLGIDNERIVVVGGSAAYKGDSELIPIVGGGHLERDVVQVPRRL